MCLGSGAELKLVVLGRAGAGKRSAVCSILGLQDGQPGTDEPLTREVSKHRGEAAGRQVHMEHTHKAAEAMDQQQKYIQPQTEVVKTVQEK